MGKRLAGAPSAAILLIAFFLIFTFMGVAGAAQATGQSANPGEKSSAAATASSTNTVDPNCRYGVAAWNSQLDWIPTLGAGWHINFNASSPKVPGAEFVPVIRVRQDKQGSEYLPTYTVTPSLADGSLKSAIQSKPGHLWLVGNEPDVPVEPQGNFYPDVYARAYHELYYYVKKIDPTAQVGIAGMSMATPIRLQYLDIVWNAYVKAFREPMPVDVWNIHVYILPERNYGANTPSVGSIPLGVDPAIAIADSNNKAELCALDNVYCFAEHDDVKIFKEQIIAFRTWMAQHKPLILSEFSILYPFLDYDDPVNPTVCFLQDELGNCFTPDRVNDYMDATFAFLETATDKVIGYPQDNYRLVQQWLWFSMGVALDYPGGSSNLLKDDLVVPDPYHSYTPGSLEAFTKMGLRYREEVLGQVGYVNLKAGRAVPAIAPTLSPSNTATVTLQVEFYNNGNNTITEPFQVTFYKDIHQTQEIGTVTVEPELTGCARRTYTASLVWENVPASHRRYWVRVNSAGVNGIDEGTYEDNVARGTIIAGGSRKFLPVLTKSP
jgi:hypothetical protein